MDSLFHYHKNLVLRTPSFSFDSNFTIKDLNNALENDDFLEALYLASPVLFESCLRLKTCNKLSEKDTKKVYYSLTKYYSRSKTRCTPFGLFAGITILNWAESQNLVLNEQKKRNTSFDMEFLYGLAKKLGNSPNLKFKLKYFTNNSSYLVANKIRYVEVDLSFNKISHKISEVDQNKYIKLILNAAKKGMLFEELLKILIEKNIDESDGKIFLEELIEIQLLTNELEPKLTGESYLEQIIEIITKANQPKSSEISNIVNILNNLKENLNKLDNNLSNKVSAYKNIIETTKQLEVNYESNYLFQVDYASKYDQSLSIDIAIQKKINKTIYLLNKLQLKHESTELNSFANRFAMRYESQEIPLLLALDAEIGVGYNLSVSNSYSSLLDNLDISKPKTENVSFDLSPKQNLILEKLFTALREKKTEIDITEADLAHIQVNAPNLPTTMSVAFRLLANSQLFFESVSGSSGVNLISRFHATSTQLERLIQDIYTIEKQKEEEEVILAEIVHLPQSRVGNILSRPSGRDYQIPILTNCESKKISQIFLEDLMISVKNGLVVLRSKKLNKIVVPKLSSAHNYKQNSLPIYQFFCDLQHQDKFSGITFSWGELKKIFTYFPKVILEDVIVSPSTWYFKKNEIKNLNKGTSDENLINEFQTFIDYWKIPQYFVLADGDNEFLVNTKNELLVLTFLDSIKNKTEITIKEFFWDDNIANFEVKNKTKKPFTNQFIATIINNGLNKTTEKEVKVSTNNSIRYFDLGSEWIYFKIYCGEKTANNILSTNIAKIVKYLFNEKIISKWFFIRYTDPDFHLRVRLQLKDINQLSNVINTFKKHLNSLVKNGSVYKIQTETYIREIERYGSENIDLVENIFYLQSNAFIQYLKSVERNEDSDWIFSIASTNSFLDNFGFTLKEKIHLLTILVDGFGKEFEITDNIHQIDSIYRKYRVLLDNLNISNYSLIEILNIQKNEEIQILNEINRKSKIDKNTLAASLIHMLVNKNIPTAPRMHELIIYNLMLKMYKSQKARQT